MMRNSPHAKVAKQLCERRGLVVSIETAGVREDPSMAAAKRLLLQPNAGIFHTGDDAVRADPDKGNHRRPPTFDFGRKPPAAGPKLLVRELIGPRRGAGHHVGNAIFEIK